MHFHHLNCFNNDRIIVLIYLIKYVYKKHIQTDIIKYFCDIYLTYRNENDDGVTEMKEVRDTVDKYSKLLNV